MGYSLHASQPLADHLAPDDGNIGVRLGRPGSVDRLGVAGVLCYDGADIRVVCSTRRARGWESISAHWFTVPGSRFRTGTDRWIVGSYFFPADMPVVRDWAVVWNFHTVGGDIGWPVGVSPVRVDITNGFLHVSDTRCRHARNSRWHRAARVNDEALIPEVVPTRSSA